MKYKDILEDVLEGKWVRPHKGSAWVRMIGDGRFEDERGNAFIMYKSQYKHDTWEVKPDIPEEIYVWGVSIGTDDEGYDTYLLKDKTFTLRDPETVSDIFKAKAGTSILLKEDGKALLSKSKPQKYKLVPVDEEGRNKFSNYSVDDTRTIKVNPDEPEEIRIVIESVNKPRGHTPSIGAFVVGGSVEVHQKFKLIPVDEEIKGSRAQVNRDREHYWEGKFDMWEQFSIALRSPDLNNEAGFHKSLEKLIKSMYPVK